MKRSVTYSVLAAAIFSALSFPAFAADNADSNVTTKDVIVTATRTEQEVKNVPNSVQVITADDIQKLGATDVYQALALADNVNITPQGNGFGKRISIRGMATNEGLILVNGHRVANEDTSTSQNLMTLQRINVNNIERIEIVRGAASAQYGSDALSGVINIITKKSGNEESITAGVSTGTESINNYYHVNTGDIGKFSASLDVNIGKDRNRMMQNLPKTATSDGRTDMGYLYGPKQNWDLSGTYKFNDKQSLTLDASYYKANQEADWTATGKSTVTAIKGMIASVVTGTPEKPGMAAGMGMSPEDQNKLIDKLTNKYIYYNPYKATLDQEQKDVSLTFNGKTDKNDYMIRAYYSNLKKSRLLPYEIFGDVANGKIFSNTAYDILHQMMPGRYPNEPVPSTFGDTNKYTVTGLEAKDSMYIGDNHTVTFGGDYVRNKIEGSNIAGASKQTNTYAAYLQDEWMVGDKLLVIPAVRYDHHSDFGSKTSPKLGATYFINNNNRLKANWGKGFKAPTVTELYSDFYHSGETIYGNPDLKPETSNNFDVSYETEFGNSFAKLTYFHNKVENYITTKEIIPQVKSQYINLPGTTKTHGVELTLGHNFNKYLSAKVDSNWTNASNNVTSGANAGHGVDGIAKNITTTQFTYDDLKPYGFNFTLWDQFAYKYSDGSDEYTYNTLNFVVTKKYGEGKRVFLGLDNLLDKKVAALNVDGLLWRVGAEVKF